MWRIGALVVAVSTVLQAQASDRWALTELWRSGGDTRQQVAFDDVVDMRLAANGHLLVLLAGASPRLLFVDNAGRLVRVITGALETAFEEPNGVLQLSDGQIVVNEPHKGQMTVFTETGRFVRHVTYDPWGYLARWTALVHDDGAVYEPVAVDGRLVWRQWMPDLSEATLLPSTGCDFGLVSAAPNAGFDFSSDRGVRRLAVPFMQPQISLARGRSGATWTGIGPDYRTIVRTPWLSCEDDARIELTGDLQPVPDDERLAAQERVRQLASNFGAAVPDLERIPAVLPAFHTVRVDRQERLWVERGVAPDTRAFGIYSTDGRHLADAEVRLPIDTFKPVVFNDNQIYYFTEDGSGWTWLVAMRIERVN